MKKEFAQTFGSILIAYGKGEPVVRKTVDEEYWHDIDPNEHMFEFTRYIYARKTEGMQVVPNVPKCMIAKSEYRPYEPYEVLYELEKHNWKVCYHNAVYTVQSVDAYGKIWIGDKWHKNPKQGFEELTWYDDNTPYGALQYPV